MNIATRTRDSLRRWYWRRAFDRSDGPLSDAAQSRQFAQIGLDEPAALARLNENLSDLKLPPFSYERDSIHWLLFAGLSIQRSAQRLLEIGTYDGRFTALLARLFPTSEIVTVDLPVSDPILRTTYGRTGDAAFGEFKARQRHNLSARNIRFIEANSFFLPGLVEPSFDIVWLDGGHLYPSVAWDFCNAWHLTRVDADILCDDVIPNPNGVRNAYVSPDSYELTEFLRERTASNTTMFLKRRGSNFSADPRRRKFVAHLRKLPS
jgi:predicted O-methyltransferase YrrM